MTHKNCRLSGLDNTSLNVMKVECMLDFITSYEGSSSISEVQVNEIKNTLENSIVTVDNKVV